MCEEPFATVSIDRCFLSAGFEASLVLYLNNTLTMLLPNVFGGRAFPPFGKSGFERAGRGRGNRRASDVLAYEGWSCVNRIERARQVKRKIPREEWGAIVARHMGGESLASIARAYNCTPPAIGYIVRQDSNTHGVEPAAKQLGAEESHELRTAPGPKLLPAGTPGRANEPAPHSARKTGSFDFALREAMTLEVSAFLVAFDAVVAEPSKETFEALRAGADRLLRATARIRIELEPFSVWKKMGKTSRATMSSGNPSGF